MERPVGSHDGPNPTALVETVSEQLELSACTTGRASAVTTTKSG